MPVEQVAEHRIAVVHPAYRPDRRDPDGTALNCEVDEIINNKLRESDAKKT